MGEQGARRAGEPGRRPAAVERNGTPRRELAHWLRRALFDLGDPTLETMLRGLPDEARLSRSALAKALRGETFPDLPLVRSVLHTAGADDAELEAWSGYWRHLDDLERRRRQGEAVVAGPPRWVDPEPGPDTPLVVDEPPAEPAPPADPSRRRVRAPVLVVLGAALGAGLALLVVGLVGGWFRPSEPAAAAVLDPVTSTVPKTFRLVGNYNGLPEGTLLWATTFDPGTGRYFPQDKPCVTRDDESFDCGQYYLGRQFAPDTDPYRVDLFVADSGASNALLQYQIDKGGPDGPNPGLTALPPGTTVIGTRTYRRS